MHRKTRKRYENPDHIRYLTFSCYGRRPLLNDIDARDAVASQLMLARARLEFRLFAWVIMPEHVHLLILPHKNGTVPQILMAVKRPVSAKLLRSWKESQDPRLHLATMPDGSNRFWQAGGGYDRNILSEFSEKLGYIHHNPVRRGLVNRSEDWDWSSARAWAGLETRWPEVDRTKE